MTGGGAAAIPLPFDDKVGPNKRASPYLGRFHSSNKDRNGILLHEGGTWRADAQVTLDAGIGSAFVQLYLSLWDKQTRTMVSESRFDTQGVTGRLVSSTISKTFVIERKPENVDRYVVCRSMANSGSYWPVKGGDRWSYLSVNRWDLDGSGRMPGTGDATDNGGTYT